MASTTFTLTTHDSPFTTDLEGSIGSAMKTIGLIGGMSWESTAHYYALLTARPRGCWAGSIRRR
jgi:hypothetical protein